VGVVELAIVVSVVEVVGATGLFIEDIGSVVDAPIVEGELIVDDGVFTEVSVLVFIGSVGIDIVEPVGIDDISDVEVDGFAGVEVFDDMDGAVTGGTVGIAGVPELTDELVTFDVSAVFVLSSMYIY
jgi:hypothetical protein